MQLTPVFLAAISAVSVSATPSWLMGDQTPIKAEYKVPGDNPLYFCGDPADDILEIESADIDPNPPTPGQKLSIKAKGNFKDKVEQGFKMHLQVKYGLITLINQEADGCDTIGKADLECPLDKGEMTLTKDVDLPREIPPGTYTVLADVYTEQGDKITCLTAKIAFHRHGGFTDENDKKNDKPVEHVIKMGQPSFKMSGPLAGIVQERLRRRNEL
ncbi:Phosphatidylglycerol/phosphatidylinositol transfer protein [Pleosporales sp. CAS-2024a]